MRFYYILFLGYFVNTCLISGTDIGECVYYENILDQASFCKEYLQNHVCVPVSRSIWPEYTISYKNKVIQQLFIQNIEQMLIQQFVHRDSVLNFDNSQKCSSAYKKFLCKMNFPPCDSNKKTIQLCKSVCEQFYTSCGKSTALCYLTYTKIKPGFAQC